MILWRPGEPEFNVVYSATGQDPGIRDPRLTERGHEQAHEAAIKLAEQGVKRTLASPFTRTLETAAVLGLPTTIEAAVRERGGPYGEPPAGPTRRIRVEVDVREELLEAVRERYHLTSRRATVEFALRRAAVTPMSKEEALRMEGVGWDGDLEAMRSGDPGAPW